MNVPTPDHPSDHEPLHPTEGMQPDPTLEEGRASLFRVAGTLLACPGIVVLVLYGLTRPVEQPQMAASEPSNTSETAPANNAGGKTAEPNAPAQNAQPNPQKPSTTGQGSAGGGQGQAGQASGPPAAGGAATVGGADAKPAPAR